MLFGSNSERRTSGNNSHAAADQQDANPARQRDLLMQKQLRKQCDQNVADRGRRQNKGEVSPGERDGVGGKKSQQQNNPNCNPGSEEGADQGAEVADGNVADGVHAAVEANVAQRAEQCNGSQDQILAQGQLLLLGLGSARGSFTNDGGAAALHILLALGAQLQE